MDMHSEREHILSAGGEARDPLDHLPQQPQPSNEISAAQRFSFSFPVVGALTAVLLIGLAVVLPSIGRGSDQSVAAQVVQPTVTPTVTPTATPSPTPITPTSEMCTSGKEYLTLIAARETTGDYPGAAALAESTLALSDLCERDRLAITRAAITNGIRSLSLAVFDPRDRNAQQQLVDRYLSLRTRAADANIPVEGDLAIARQSYAVSQFPLTITAIHLAYESHQFNPAVDRETTKLYISATFNLGKYLVEGHDPESDDHREGRSWLSLSHTLAVRFRTGQGDAGMLLSQIAGSDETHWPAPAPSPLLDAQP